MSKFLILVMLVFLLSACGGSSPNALNDTAMDTATQEPSSSNNTSSPSAGLMTTEQVAALANSFCLNQKKLQIISTSLLSAYTPTGNSADMNYCGGENLYSTLDSTFTLQLKDYCVSARGRDVLLNGSIAGATESGSNFTSSINSLNISANDLDLDITGNSYAGRADDNFVNLQIMDQMDGSELLMEEVSIKKGEFDFGYVTFDGLNRVKFKFITYFNADNTAGLLFIYGAGDDKIIISGDAGEITAVYSKDRHDPGTWVDLPCNL